MIVEATTVAALALRVAAPAGGPPGQQDEEPRAFLERLAGEWSAVEDTGSRLAPV